MRWVHESWASRQGSRGKEKWERLVIQTNATAEWALGGGRGDGRCWVSGQRHGPAAARWEVDSPTGALGAEVWNGRTGHFPKAVVLKLWLLDISSISVTWEPVRNVTYTMVTIVSDTILYIWKLLRGWILKVLMPRKKNLCVVMDVN